MNRRHLLTAPLAAAVPVAASAAAPADQLHGVERIRIWASMAQSAYAGRIQAAGETEADALAQMTKLFEHVVGPLPYRYRSHIHGRVIVVTHLRSGGMPAIRREDGTPIGRQT